MAKYTPTPLASSYGSIAAINANLDAISTALENTLSRDGTTPNTMSASLDMNNQSILNLPDGVTPGEPVTIRQYDAAASPSAASATASAEAAALSAADALASEVAALSSSDNATAQAAAALTSANNASNSASVASGAADTATAQAVLALSYTASGFGGTLLDLGLVTDATIYFPTDLGVLV